MIVENIPDEYFNIESIKEYFTRFGTIVDVKINDEQKNVTLEFSTHLEAKNCHSSPDPIFDNRFVKVYWKPKSFSPKKVELTQEQLKQNLQRMQEIKYQKIQQQRESEQALIELNNSRKELIAKQLIEQDRVMEMIKNDSLSVQEKNLLMDGLKLLQDSIKSLMDPLNSCSNIINDSNTHQRKFAQDISMAVDTKVI